MRVDIDSRVSPVDVRGKAEVHGPELVGEEARNPITRVGSFTWQYSDRMVNGELDDPAMRLTLMDERGFDVVGVTTTPPSSPYRIDHDLAISFTAAVKDSLGRFGSAPPDCLFMDGPGNAGFFRGSLVIALSLSRFVRGYSVSSRCAAG